MGKKIISFSLWGNNPKYTIGAVKNAELAMQYYPGWYCRYYIGQSVPSEIVRRLQNYQNVQIKIMQELGDWNSMFWRFLAAGDNEVEVMISRDTDSRLGQREKDAVNNWLQSNKSFHIMRDHPWHTSYILGGMWGVRGKKLKNMRQMINDYEKNNKYQVDQSFLNEFIYPIVKDDACVHDEFFENRPFPTKRKKWEFVGEIFDENDCSCLEHEILLEQELIKKAIF